MLGGWLDLFNFKAHRAKQDRIRSFLGQVDRKIERFSREEIRADV